MEVQHTTWQNAKNYIHHLLSGEVIPSKRVQFTVIAMALGVFHILFAILFLILEFYVLGFYNIFSAYLFIVVFSRLLKKDKFQTVSIVAFMEITFFSCFSTFMAGPDWGFGMYNIGVTPSIYFITYSIPNIKKSLRIPTVLSLLGMIFFIIMKLYLPYMNFQYDSSPYPTLTTVVYILNAVAVFIAIMLLCSFFALEIRYKEHTLEKQNTVLEGISSVDPLTGLRNRRSMIECINESVEVLKSKGTLFSLAIGDIDNFKMVNDTYGHNVGDDILIMVSNTINRNLPEGSVLCRWGGEEFLILIKSPEQTALPSVEKIREAISKETINVELPDGDIKLGVTMTFGLSQYIHGFDINKVIACADDYLYKGKAYGKNRVVCSKTQF